MLPGRYLASHVGCELSQWWRLTVWLVLMVGSLPILARAQPASSVLLVTLPPDVPSDTLPHASPALRARLYALAGDALARQPEASGDPRADRIVVFVDQSGASVLPDRDAAVRGVIFDTPTATNELSFTFNSGVPWTPDELSLLQAYIADFYPVARSVYGEPAFDLSVNVRKDPTIGFAGLYFPAMNEMVLRDATEPDVFCHEMLHAFRDDNIIQVGTFEEGMTRAAEVEVFDRLVTYPHWDLFHSYYQDQYYEGFNTPYVACGGCTGRLLGLYQLPGYAWGKVVIENSLFLSRFNAEVYRLLPSDPALLVNEPSLRAIAESIQPTVEGVPFARWYGSQSILSPPPLFGEFVALKVDYTVCRFAADSVGSTTYVAMVPNAPLDWTLSDARGTVLDYGRAETTWTGCVTLAPSVPADYQGRIDMMATAATAAGVVADAISFSRGGSGVFGIVRPFNTGTVSVTSLDAVGPPAVAQVVDGAFTLPALESLRGRFRAEFVAPSGQRFVRDFTKDASRYFLPLVEAGTAVTVSLAAPVAVASESGPRPAAFTVSRTGTTSVPLKVAYATAGTATSGTDYVAPSQELTIPIGAVSATLLVVPVDDALPEAPETIVVQLMSAQGYGVGASASATATLFSNDSPVDEDEDGDGLPSPWEIDFGLNPRSAIGVDGAIGDPDGDGVLNLDEYRARTHPRGSHSGYLAEGATSAFFASRLALFNPGATVGRALLRFLRSDGSMVFETLPVPPLTRRTIDVQTLAGLETAEFSLSFESDEPLVVDRTMTWDRRGYGSHAETSVPAPALTWYLAEGATHSGFQLFYLIENPGDAAATVEVTYLRPAPLPAVVKNYAVGPRSRFTIWVNREHPGLAATDVSAILRAGGATPIIVERAMYLTGHGRTFNAGHAGAGVTAPATQWFLAEGATGPFFDLYVLVANPTDDEARIDARYLLGDGTTVTKSYRVAARSRFNIAVDLEAPSLANAAVSTTVTSTNGVPVVVERAMWWPGSWATWHEAHVSRGATSTGTTWALAEGEVAQDARRTDTFVLIANTSPFAGQALVTLFSDDGLAFPRVYRLPPNSRTNVWVKADFPEVRGRTFSALVESVAAPGEAAAAQVVVERAMYSDAEGVTWAAGTGALATLVP